MPLGVPFKDKYAKVGRPVKAPASEIELITKDAEDQQLIFRCEYKNGYLSIDHKFFLYKKIRIKKIDARSFADWILKVTKIRRIKKDNSNAKN